MSLKQNNTGDRITPIAFFCMAFPIVASLWEFSNVFQELISECYIHGWIVHIPLAGLVELLFLIAVTAGQYLVADKISHWRGWSQPSVCASIEVILLLSVALS